MRLLTLYRSVDVMSWIERNGGPSEDIPRFSRLPVIGGAKTQVTSVYSVSIWKRTHSDLCYQPWGQFSDWAKVLVTASREFDKLWGRETTTQEDFFPTVPIANVAQSISNLMSKKGVIFCLLNLEIAAMHLAYISQVGQNL